MSRLIFSLVLLCLAFSAHVAGLLMSMLPTVLSASLQAAACYYLFLGQDCFVLLALCL